MPRLSVAHPFGVVPHVAEGRESRGTPAEDISAGTALIRTERLVSLRTKEPEGRTVAAAATLQRPPKASGKVRKQTFYQPGPVERAARAAPNGEAEAALAHPTERGRPIRSAVDDKARPPRSRGAH